MIDMEDKLLGQFERTIKAYAKDRLELVQSARSASRRCAGSIYIQRGLQTFAVIDYHFSHALARVTVRSSYLDMEQIASFGILVSRVSGHEYAAWQGLKYEDGDRWAQVAQTLSRLTVRIIAEMDEEENR